MMRAADSRQRQQAVRALALAAATSSDDPEQQQAAEALERGAARADD